MYHEPLIILLMAPPEEGGGGSGMINLLFIAAIIAVMYFFMIRPQQKKAKDQREFQESVKKGDKVVTLGGVHGKIIKMQDKTFILETEGDTRLKIDKSALSLESTRTHYGKKDK